MWMIDRRTDEPLRLQSDGQELLGYVQWCERSQRLADRTMRWVVGGMAESVIPLNTGAGSRHRTVSRSVTLIVMAMLSRQVQGFRQAGSLCRENHREQDCEQALFHVIFNALSSPTTVRLLTRARLFMIIRMHSQ